MREILCKSCGQEIIHGIETGGEDIFRLHIICVCGKKNIESFLGSPKLSGTKDYFFEFVDDNTVICKKRKVK